MPAESKKKSQRLTCAGASRISGFITRSESPGLFGTNTRTVAGKMCTGRRAVWSCLHLRWPHTTVNHERLDHSTACLSCIRATLGIRRHPDPSLAKIRPHAARRTNLATAVASSRQGLEVRKSLAGACGCCFTGMFSAVCYRFPGPAAKIIEISGNQQETCNAWRATVRKSTSPVLWWNVEGQCLCQQVLIAMLPG